MSATTENVLINLPSEEDFKQQVVNGLLAKNSGNAVVVHFWAEWCAPCFEMDKFCVQLAQKYANVKFFKVEAEKLPNLTEQFNVHSVPAFVFFPASNQNPSKLSFTVLEGANPPELAKRTKALSENVSISSSQTQQEPAGGATDLNSRIRNLINRAQVMLFMKGSPETPKCGFSSKIVEILRSANIQFSAFDILSDEAVRQGLKTYSNWPTYPQLYVKGELVGGLDVVKEMAAEGDLKEQLGISSEEAKDELNERLKKLINQAPVMLFMKGSPEVPKCGFSSKIVDILKQHGVKFSSFDILTDEAVRQGLKTYSNWPTYPQLYSKGQLIGGLDVVKELAEQGELLENLE
ncbi:hypothetical protein C9374_011726 [Naegleria lovaniensis]|uniref:Thioredoxin domain-containing protein n=1 Tax=Naegleria lovaniensis TaxID=51637 RepID=A0AA88GCB2_NAELO|nr:uncharacterized protein C9374_011726 [Naegleria lovaniensis]KAG2373841.1 hypothetical protein C9374_011726 [Naegleria lovaniensis]